MAGFACDDNSGWDRGGSHASTEALQDEHELDESEVIQVGDSYGMVWSFVLNSLKVTVGWALELVLYNLQAAILATGLPAASVDEIYRVLQDWLRQGLAHMDSYEQPFCKWQGWQHVVALAGVVNEGGGKCIAVLLQPLHLCHAI